jgi:DNA-binding transcriptional LysR family regulator
LHAYFTVVRLGTMGRAARELGVSQPAISKVIADLEHALGVPLLDRNRRGVEPTMYGRALLNRGLVAFDELKQGIRDIQSLADPTSGELTIGSGLTAAFLPQLMHRFYEKYPRVVVRVDDVPSPVIRSPALRERKVDLIFARLSTPIPDDLALHDLNVEILFDDPIVIAAGKHTPWARRRKVDLAELINEPWILNPPTSWSYTCVAQAFQALGLDMPKVTFLTFSLELMAYFLTNAPFIAAWPFATVRLNSAIKALPVGLTFPPMQVAMVTLKNRTLSPIVERFMECAREVAKSFAEPQGRMARQPKVDVS